MARSLANHYHKQLGLTLIEVLIALAIVAIALAAVIKAASQNIRGTSYLQSKTVAMWVGQEVMTNARLGLIVLPRESDPLEKSTTMLGNEWYWQASQSPTSNKHINKMTVDVFQSELDRSDENETPLVRIESYVYREE